MFMSLCLVGMMASCGSDDDPTPDDVTPVEPDEVINTVTTGSLTITVSALDGTPISGASITAASTDNSFAGTSASDGTLTENSISKAGKYSIYVTKDGYIDGEGEATVVIGETATCEITLSAEPVEKEVTVSETEETTTTIATEADIETATSAESSAAGSLQTEDKQVATVEIAATVPAKTEAVAIVTSSATEEEVTAYKATVATKIAEETADVDADVAAAEKELAAATNEADKAKLQKALDEAKAYQEQYTKEAEEAKADPVKYYDDLTFYVKAVSSESAAVKASSTSTTKAKGEEYFLFGSALSCNKLIKPEITSPIKLGFTLDSSVQPYVRAWEIAKDGSKTMTTASWSGATATIAATKFASYGLYLTVDVTETEGSEAVTISGGNVDNTTGSSAVTVKDLKYSYKKGVEVTDAGTGKLAAYLLEALAKRLDNVTYTTAEGTYAVNTSCPAGTGMTFTAKQAYTDVTITAGSVSVKARKYGNVTVGVETYNRDHTGGAGK